MIFLEKTIRRVCEEIFKYYCFIIFTIFLKYLFLKYFRHVLIDVSRETLKYNKSGYYSCKTFIKNIKNMFHVKHLLDK